MLETYNVLSWVRMQFSSKNCSHFLIAVAVNFIYSCSQAVEVAPPTIGLSSATVYSSDNTAAAAVNGIYQGLVNSNIELSGGTYGVPLKFGLASDELRLYNSDPVLAEYYSNGLEPTNASNASGWAYYYKYIYHCNAVLEGLEKSTGVTEAIKRQLKGETLFTRSLLYFYLTNIYGDVPIILSTDYRKNAIVSRSASNKVYEQIISDLKEAQSLLSDNYSTSQGTPTSERLRPNLSAVTALLSRIYLYSRDWLNAEAQATLVINNPMYSLPSDLNDVFLKNSTEAILQFQPTDAAFNTFDGYAFILEDNFTSETPTALSTQLLESFESGDNRFMTWIGKFNNFYFPFKYKVKGGNVGLEITEYLMVLRLAEQYLIRAEARTQTGQYNLAVDDLNVIRRRAGLANYSGSIDKTSLLTVILHERQVELFTEAGHRWFDLKRMGEIDNVMRQVSPTKGGSWNPNWRLLPIPQSELLNDPNLTQNAGY